MGTKFGTTKTDKMKYFITLFLLTTFIFLQAQITISEILFAQPLWNTDLQYIELLNFSEDTINLSEWSISGDINLSELPDIKLLPNEKYIISSDSNALIDLGIIMDMAEWGPQQIFGNPFFLLFDPNGQEVVRIDYEENSNWPESIRGVSIELCDPSLSANDGLNWALAENSLFSGTNELLGTPGEINTCSEIRTSSISVVEEELISIYPNPCKSILRIKNSQTYESLIVYNSAGRELLKSFNSNLIDVSNLNSGFYILSILDNGERIMKQFEKI